MLRLSSLLLFILCFMQMYCEKENMFSAIPKENATLYVGDISKEAGLESIGTIYKNYPLVLMKKKVKLHGENYYKLNEVMLDVIDNKSRWIKESDFEKKDPHSLPKLNLAVHKIEKSKFTSYKNLIYYEFQSFKLLQFDKDKFILTKEFNTEIINKIRKDFLKDIPPNINQKLFPAEDFSFFYQYGQGKFTENKVEIILKTLELNLEGII